MDKLSCPSLQASASHHHTPLSSLTEGGLKRRYRASNHSWVLRFSILLLMCLACISPCYSSAGDTPTLEWELVNPFRFIRDKASIDELRRVYDGLPNGEKTAAKLERVLQDQDENRVTELRRKAEERCSSEANPEDKKRCIVNARVPYLGWFAQLAFENHNKTCWDSKTLKFRNSAASDTMSGCSDYINPKSHLIRVWVSNPSPFSAQSYQWLHNGRPLTKSKPCSSKYQQTVCVEFEIPYGEPTDVLLKVDNSDITLPPLRIEDKLVVGLGDSFAAGEGNPDIPAQFKEGRKDSDFIYRGWRRAISPKQDKDAQAVWLDRRCHRSMYSYQFKTALRLALSNPKQAITFVSFACSGAITSDIIKSEQKAKEGGGKIIAQLKALKETLSRNEGSPQSVEGGMRKIDYLLLSTGGNDIGFAEVVADIVLSGKLRKFYRKLFVDRDVKELINGNYRIIDDMLLGVPNGKKGNYRDLQDSLFTELGGFKIDGCSKGKPCDRIILTAYPNLLTNENKALCKIDRQEFDNPFKEDNQRGARLSTANKIFERIKAVQLQARVDLGWSVANDHVDTYFEHGFCARNGLGPQAAESFAIPTLSNETWHPFAPWDYRTYGRQQRWVRLPVDSKLSVDQRRKILKWTADIGFEDDWSTIMHPTAQGLAHNADANVAVILSGRP